MRKRCDGDGVDGDGERGRDEDLRRRQVRITPSSPVIVTPMPWQGGLPVTITPLTDHSVEKRLGRGQREGPGKKAHNNRRRGK